MGDQNAEQPKSFPEVVAVQVEPLAFFFTAAYTETEAREWMAEYGPAYTYKFSEEEQTHVFEIKPADPEIPVALCNVGKGILLAFTTNTAAPHIVGGTAAPANVDP